MKSKVSPRNVQRRREGTVRAKVGSLKYAAMKIDCSLPTLYDLIEGGKLRSHHIGRAHRVSEQAVADCISLLEQESAQERLARRVPNMDPLAGSRGREPPRALSAERQEQVTVVLWQGPMSSESEAEGQVVNGIAAMRNLTGR